MCVSVWDNVCVESSVSAWDFSSHFYEPICRQGLKPQALDSPHCCATPALKRLWVVPVRLAHHTHAHTARFASCSHSVWNTCINNHELRTFPCMTCKLYVHTHTNTNATKESVLFSFFLFFKTSCWFCVRSEKSSAVHGKLMCRYSGLISHLHNVGIPSFFVYYGFCTLFICVSLFHLQFLTAW